MYAYSIRRTARRNSPEKARNVCSSQILFTAITCWHRLTNRYDRVFWEEIKDKHLHLMQTAVGGGRS